MSVTITLPDRGDVRVSPVEAAQLLVSAYGLAAVDQPIAGPRSDFDATWCEVDRLLCAHCGERLDWSIDHRSLYVWELAHG